MEKVRFGKSLIGGLTAEHHAAFDAVVDAAAELASLGWPVNWQQNVQLILAITEFGLRDGKLVDRFEHLPDSIALGEELLFLGSVVYYQQNRATDGAESRFRPKVLSAKNRYELEGVLLHRRKADEKVPAGSRYCSDWIPGTAGASYRIAA